MAARDSSETMRERAFVPVLVYVGTVVSIISSLGAPLIPSIARDLDASVSSAQWSLTATLLVGRRRHAGRRATRRRAPPSHRHARLPGDRRRRRRARGDRRQPPVLVAGRAMQGVGLALMPLTMAAARDHLSDRRARA